MERFPPKMLLDKTILALISLLVCLLFLSPQILASPDTSAERLIAQTQDNLYTKECKDTALYSSDKELYAVPEAAFFVAVCLQQEPTTPKALKQAIKLLKYSYSQDYADAAFQISMSYNNGYGVEIDAFTAVDWHRKFERLSKPNTKPIMIITGEHVERVTETELLNKLESKANSGDSEAQYTLAGAYQKGQWSPIDMKKAMHWYTIAAKNGNNSANFMLGYFYCRGIGVERSIEKSNHHIKLSNRNTTCR